LLERVTRSMALEFRGAKLIQGVGGLICQASSSL
jgi:hypothetical protein